MKSTLSFSARHRHAMSRRGVALLLVLGCLVLLTTLILAFLISGQSNLKSSKLYANGSSVKTLADSTVNIVMAQIQQATSNGTTVAWASQPGMIRTYSNTGAPLTNYRLYSWDHPSASGAFDVNTDETQISNAATNPWYSSPSVFVDLNQPVADSTGTPHYPIIDGNPSDFVSYSGAATAGQSVNTYPPYSTTYNGAPVSVPQIDGFWVQQPTANASSGSTVQPPTPAGPAVATAKLTLASSPVANIVPMPVKWLYVLQDGTVVAPDASSIGSTVTISTATVTNPIVGRIAYWTDDETAKININTASEGNFSDTPRAQGITDFAIAQFPAVQNEFQRYPGHPATTCLSPVLDGLYNSVLSVDHSKEPAVSGYTPSASVAATYAPYQPYYDLNPHLNTDTTGNLGSQAGTVQFSAVTTGAGLTAKSDRLFTSVDEMMFASNLFGDNSHTASAVPTGSGGSRPLSKSGAYPSLTQAYLQKARFFLTASSRAPDVNLFNQPRIVTWPVSSTNDTNHRTIYDQALAFCGTIGNLPYYFQRSRNDHPTIDLPPGYVSPATDLTRNRGLIQYLQGLTSQNIPGFGGNFLSKYPNAGGGTTAPTERDQILTEIFDYIRCVNLIDGSNGSATFVPFAPIAAAPYPTVYSGTTGSSASTGDSNTTHAGSGCVVPIYDVNNKTKGFGRYPTVQKVSLVFICTGWNDGLGGLATDINYQAPLTSGVAPFTTSTYTTGTLAGKNAPWGYYSPTSNTTLGTPTSPMAEGVSELPNGVAMPTIPDGNMQVQAALVVSYFDPAQGNVTESPLLCTQVIGLGATGAFQWGPDPGHMTSMGFPSSATGTTPDIGPLWASNGTTYPQYAPQWGGNLDFRTAISNMVPNQVGTARYNPFFSNVQNFPYNPTTALTTPPSFYFSGGTITINLLLPTITPNWPIVPAGTWPLTNSELASRPPIQSITVSFPATATQLPLPTYMPSAVNNNFPTQQGRQDRGRFDVRCSASIYNLGSNPEFIVGDIKTSNGTPAQVGDTVRSVRAYPGDIRMIAGQLQVTDTGTTGTGYFDSAESKINAAAGMPNWTYSSATQHFVHNLRSSGDYPYYGAQLGQLVPGVAYCEEPTGGALFDNNLIINTVYQNGLNYFSGAGNNATQKGAFIGGGITGSPGDWDNGFGYTADGPFINKPDEGNYDFSGGPPYFGATNFGQSAAGETYFSPNHLMSGPVMFGSLPTGVIHNTPWQTLLFCPNPPAGITHPGFGAPQTAPTSPTDTIAPGTLGYTTPPDHLLLDLFTMPVVEPYPISEPLSTAGRINMNYQIAPFSYIERQTGLRAVLKAERLTVIPDSAGSAYKNAANTAAKVNAAYDYRVPINADQTLLAFDNFFASGKDIFRSASQICSMFLYPQRDALIAFTGVAGPLWDADNKNITNFWNGNLTGTTYSVSTTPPTASSWPSHYLTGDNSREKPYANIYPRLTTKSNTYTVHYYVQTLQKIVGSSPTQWNEATDQVTGEYRGSTTIERYVNPSDATLPDFTSAPTTALDSWYKFRVISTKQFAP